MSKRIGPQCRRRHLSNFINAVKRAEAGRIILLDGGRNDGIPIVHDTHSTSLACDSVKVTAVLWGCSIAGQEMADGYQVFEWGVAGVIIGLSPAVTALLGNVDSQCPAMRRVGGRSPVLRGGGVAFSGRVPGHGRSAAARQPAGLFPLTLKLFVGDRQLLLHGRIKRPPVP